MDNYIVINDKKAELTEEQLKQLGINVEVNKETPQREGTDSFDNATLEAEYYFNDRELAKQFALHQVLRFNLLTYAYENDAFANDWTDPNSAKYFISKHTGDNAFYVDRAYALKYSFVVYFTSEKVTEQAFEEVVKPFMKEHPEFVW